MPEPPGSTARCLVETIAIGVCGTDLEICSAAYGWAPPGEQRLVLGHESLGHVLEAPAGGDLAKGDLVVGIVRRPDPVPCSNCAVLEWDFCRNGQYTERGIKEHHGYCSERYRNTPDFTIKIDQDAWASSACCSKPTSVVARRGSRPTGWGPGPIGSPRPCSLTGAGPIGLLAALIGVQRGLEVHVPRSRDDGREAGPRARPRRHVPRRQGGRCGARAPTSSSSARAYRLSSSTPCPM